MTSHRDSRANSPDWVAKHRYSIPIVREIVADRETPEPPDRDVAAPADHVRQRSRVRASLLRARRADRPTHRRRA